MPCSKKVHQPLEAALRPLTPIDAVHLRFADVGGPAPRAWANAPCLAGMTRPADAMLRGTATLREQAMAGLEGGVARA